MWYGQVVAKDELMLATVRVARGLTQSSLARLSGLSQATLSKAESGMIRLDATRMATVARVLSAPPELLEQPADFYGAHAVVFHRKRASLPVSAANRLRSTLDLVHLQVGALLAQSAPVRVVRTPLPDDGYVTPEEVAQRVRRELRVSHGPIENLVSVMESAGIAVVRRDLGSVKVDALMSWPPGARPLVLLGEHAPGDRQRFSTAHELGHAVMHDVPRDDQEAEADRFASELLMPRADISSQLHDVTLARLARLKQEWGVSMAALLRRSRDLGEISDFQNRRLNIELSQAGYRTREPVDVTPEVPTLVANRVRDLLAGGATPASLARLTWMTEDDFRRTYLGEDAA